MPNLKFFYACITHNHFDHVQGIEKTAFDVRARFPGYFLTILVDETIREETATHLDTGGLKTITTESGHEDKVYDLYSFDQYGMAYTFYSKDGVAIQHMLKPTWFLRTLPTTHSPRLKGASGFAFLIHGKLVVYSGDTNQLGIYITFIDNAMSEQTDHADMPVEFYLDVATRKSAMHLYFPEIINDLSNLLEKYPTLKIILMHYDDRTLLERQIKMGMPGMLDTRVYIAKEF